MKRGCDLLILFCVQIHCCGNGGLGFRPYGGSLSKSAKVTKALLPHHLAPRLGSVCPHSGIAPRVAAMGHPWPSAAKPASLPVSPLRNACVRPAWLTGRLRSRASPWRPSGRPRHQTGALRFSDVHCLRAGVVPFGAKLACRADVVSVGAKLARDSGMTVSINIGCKTVIASKLCSHRYQSFHRHQSFHRYRTLHRYRTSTEMTVQRHHFPAATFHGYHLTGLISYPEKVRDPTSEARRRDALVGPKAATARYLIADAPLTTLAERRHCVAGKPARMPV